MFIELDNIVGGRSDTPSSLTTSKETSNLSLTARPVGGVANDRGVPVDVERRSHRHIYRACRRTQIVHGSLRFIADASFIVSEIRMP